MIPGTGLTVNRNFSSDDTNISAKNIVKSGGFLGTFAAVPVIALLGAGHLFEKSLESYAAISESAATSIEVSMIAHAEGIKSGMVMNGVAIPQKVSQRLADMVTDEIAVQIEAAVDIRVTGITEGLEGKWDYSRLNSYLDRIEALNPSIKRLMDTAIEEMSVFDMDADRIQIIVRANMASELLDKNDVTARSLVQEPGENASQFDRVLFSTLNKMRKGVSRAITEAGMIGNLNRSVLSDMAVSLIDMDEMLPLKDDLKVPGI